MAKSGAVNEASAASDQFGEVFASALQESVGVKKSPMLQSAQGLTSPVENRPVRDQKTIPNTPNVQAPTPLDLLNKPIPEAAAAVAVKTPAPMVQPAPKEQPPSPIRTPAGATNEERKKTEAVSSQSVDTAAMSYAITTPIVAAQSSLPVIVVNDKKSAPPSDEKTIPVQVPIPGHVAAIAQQTTTTPLTAIAPSDKDTESFALNLTPKAATPVQRAGTETSPAPTPKNGDNKPQITESSPAVPAKTATASIAITPVKNGQDDLSAQVVQPTKTRSLSATSSPVTTPSSLGQSSSVGRDGKPQEKEQAIVPVSGVSDAGGAKQEFAGFAPAPTPASFPKEVKDAESTNEARPVAQPLQLQDTAPAVGAAKAVAIQLQSQSGETINVKLADQGGQVQVTVRSSDPVAAASLRQDLSSLTSNLDKAGWKPEIAVAANGDSFGPVNQARQTDRNNQDSQGNKQPEWQQETPKKRQSVSDLWDELLTNQTA